MAEMIVTDRPKATALPASLRLAARLDHLALTSPDPAALAAFDGRALQHVLGFMLSDEASAELEQVEPGRPVALAV